MRWHHLFARGCHRTQHPPGVRSPPPAPGGSAFQGVDVGFWKQVGAGVVSGLVVALVVVYFTRKEQSK